ncbi:MAG: hypothetical protein AAF739_00495 [Pseudomonadota bacterium]
MTDPTTPLTLERAAALAFPEGGITARSLRTERENGRLRTFKIAGKVMTTLADIDKMIQRCQQNEEDRPKAHGSSTARTAAHGRYTTGRCGVARDAAAMTARALKERSQPTSPKSTNRATQTNVIPLQSP